MLKQIVYILSGIGITLQYAVLSIGLGFTLGTCLALLRYTGRFKYLVKAFVSVTRGTPLILQLSFYYFALSGIFGLHLSVLQAGVLAFGLNSAAYTSEIVRAGIQSIEKGQFDAAHVLQIPSFLMWRDILLPQVFQKIFPALMNEAITLLKDTALVSIIGEVDIMRRSQFIAAENMSYFFPLGVAAACYYALVMGLEILGRWFENRYTCRHDLKPAHKQKFSSNTIPEYKRAE